VPDLGFAVTGVEPAVNGLAPLLHFKVEVTNTPAEEVVHTVMLQAQIHIESARRQYDTGEKEKLKELFGTPDRWGQTLRTRHWANASTVVKTFAERTEAILPVPCTYDLNVSGTKYFNALEGGEVPLLFLFSGTVFYAAADGRLQVQQISWERECKYRMPVRTWHAMMDTHYPNSAWLALERETFQRLYAYKCGTGLATWEQVMERLLAVAEESAKADVEAEV
jgi:hypothetical protein